MYLRLVVALFGIFMMSRAQAQYYTFDGSTLNYSNQDPKNAPPPREWHVYLFKKGDATSGPAYGGGYFGGAPRNHWGLITAKTADSAMKKLKSSQDFEKRFERWMRKTNPSYEWGPDTYFNPLGPVAIYERKRESKVEAKADSLGRKFDELLDLRRSIQMLLVEEKNPFKGNGMVLADYVDNFRDVFKKQKELRDILSDVSRTSDGVMSALDNFSRELDADKAKTTKLKTDLDKAVANTSKDKVNPKLAAEMEKLIADYQSWGMRLVHEENGLMFFADSSVDSYNTVGVSVLPDLRVYKPGSVVDVSYTTYAVCSSGEQYPEYPWEHSIKLDEAPILNSKKVGSPSGCQYPSSVRIRLTSVQVQEPKKGKSSTNYSKGLKVNIISTPH